VLRTASRARARVQPPSPAPCCTGSRGARAGERKLEE
jgi:hypothetical protein